MDNIKINKNIIATSGVICGWTLNAVYTYPPPSSNNAKLLYLYNNLVNYLEKKHITKFYVQGLNNKCVYLNVFPSYNDIITKYGANIYVLNVSDENIIKNDLGCDLILILRFICDMRLLMEYYIDSSDEYNEHLQKFKKSWNIINLKMIFSAQEKLEKFKNVHE